MKKLLGIAVVLLMIVSCSKKEPELNGREYQLINAMNNAEITLSFDQDGNRYFGNAVNRYFGTYKLDGNKISFGPAGSTMMMGSEPLMEAETNYLQILPKVQSYHFDGDNLILVTDNNQELGFKYLGNIQK